jgi:DNA-binding response OmpR family regulator
VKDILIIQDSPALNQLMKFVLESEGLSVDLTETGNEGLEFAESTQYGLILLDYMLPNTNGGEVCKELRNRYLTKNTPILFVSSKEESELSVIVEQVGADGYLTPPFRGEEFINNIKKYI